VLIAACRLFQVREVLQNESSVEQGHIKSPREQSMTSLVTSHNDKSPGKALDFSGCNSRSGTGSLHPVAIEVGCFSV
jgi:hypothetical protein